jgi:hypothetical protein
VYGNLSGYARKSPKPAAIVRSYGDPFSAKPSLAPFLLFGGCFVALLLWPKPKARQRRA